MKLVIFLIICLILFLYLRNANKKSTRQEKRQNNIRESKQATSVSAKPISDIDVSMYQKRYRLMNNSESSFFHVALTTLPEGYFIFPKMRIADIIETKDGAGYYKQRNKILPKHVDFVIVDANLRIVCAIEIDGKSHDTPERQERDEMVDYIFEYVGIPLERVRVGEDFHRVCNEMKQYITATR